MVGTRRKAKAEATIVPGPDPHAADLNEIVAYNFRRARELRGLTQDEAARKLEPFLGQRLPQASISAIERAYEGERRREFDAQEILMFACAFDLPLAWFFIPPPDDHRHFNNTPDLVSELISLLLGREDQIPALEARFKELGYREETADDVRWSKLTGTPIRGRLGDYRRRRKAMLLALLDDHADNLDQAADELGAFFDHLRTTGIRGFVSENLNDLEFSLPAKYRKKKRAKPPDSTP